MARVTYSTAYVGTGNTKVCNSLALRRCTAAVDFACVYRHHQCEMGGRGGGSIPLLLQKTMMHYSRVILSISSRIPPQKQLQ